MSFQTTQSLTINGLSVSLTVQASESYLRSQSDTESDALAAHRLADLFVAAVPAASKELPRLHAAISQVLLMKTCEILREVQLENYKELAE